MSEVGQEGRVPSIGLQREGSITIASRKENIGQLEGRTGQVPSTGPGRDAYQAIKYLSGPAIILGF